MDDALKLQKLAAARNKLKSHQQKKHKKPENANTDANCEEVVQSNNEIESAKQPEEISVMPEIKSYFNTPAGITSIPSSTANYFDNINVQDPFSLQNSVRQNENLTEISEIGTTNADVVTYEDPEIIQNEIYEFVQQKQSENISDNQSNLNNDISVTEQLRQLNDQITNAVESNGYESYSNYSDLEKRNLELASNFEKEKLQCEQLQSALAENKKHVNYLERQLELIQVECETRIRNELAPLENEVSAHRKTLGIFIAEKMELSAALAHTQFLLKQKSSECEELQARLKTSRSRVADLERELNNLKEERSRYAQLQSGHNHEFEKMHQELKELQGNKAEAEQDLSEMRERLKKFQEENATLLHTCNELESKLDLAGVKIQQLSTGADPNASERFMLEKAALEKQILDLNSSLKKALSERDQAGTQYQQYVQQLNGNIAGLAEKLEASTTENENHLKRENELVQHISELEKRLQTLQQESTNNIYKQSIQNEVPKQPDPEIDVLKEKLQNLQAQNEDVQLKFETIRSERDEFIKDVETKKLAIENLELQIERLQGSQTNSTQMLADIESEKVAASRAVEQNIKLKQQLEEMQEAFIRMTNDKADLLTQLSSEEFRYKELDELQLQTNQQLKMLSDAIEIKDRELTEMRLKAENVDKQVLYQDQLQDRLRHYEAHENSAQSLSHELQHAKEEIQMLMNNNKQLEAMIAESEAKSVEPIVKNIESYGDDICEIENIVIEKPQVNTQAVQTHELNEVKPMTLPLNTEMTAARETAMRQLETKFMRTMQEIANLQDEKQMLEHIVMQLQGETDTIGEYIALYQHQRGVLKQRAIEKETQLKQLASDREHMKSQLQMLNDLIKRLLIENKISDEMLQEQQRINENASALCEEHAKMHQEMQDPELGNSGIISNDKHSHETAQQIMALLSEIKTSNLVQPSDISDNFHPCPLCSGQLITV